MTNLTIACSLWCGTWDRYKPNPNREYSPIYVSRLKDMVSKKLSVDFDFVCLSNVPEDEFREDITVIPLVTDWPAWWSKIEIFNPDIERHLNERIIMLDIDMLVIGDLDEVLKYRKDFVIYDYFSSSNFPDKRTAILRARKNKNQRLVPFYDSDMILFRNGKYRKIFDDLRDKHIEDLCGDQDWIGLCLGKNEKRFPMNWQRKMNKKDKGGKPIPFNDYKTLACHPVKNHFLAERGYTWADRFWKGKLDA